MRKPKIPHLTEFMLGIGSLGAAEIISTSFFWHKIMNNPNLTLFRPGEPIAQLSMLGVLIGIFGAIIYLVKTINNYIQKKKEIGWLATCLSSVFVVSFLWVVYIGTGV